ncbi:hypothetical protein Gohar_018415 [Gossypium harknessii]|uniref:Uncharacterized protein n=1 Tax=Gossypium harknessii TaxID=34285 RepID=A0A7J9G8Z5_9ROSI|nr:hypothetical protein [Gossypium harknessii]
MQPEPTMKQPFVSEATKPSLTSLKMSSSDQFPPIKQQPISPFPIPQTPISPFLHLLNQSFTTLSLITRSQILKLPADISIILSFFWVLPPVVSQESNNYSSCGKINPFIHTIEQFCLHQ